MTEFSIRRTSIAEQAAAAAARTLASGLREPNPYVELDEGPAWQAAYDRCLNETPDCEGSA